MGERLSANSTGRHVARWLRRLVCVAVMLGAVSSAATATPLSPSAAAPVTISSIAPATGPSTGGTSVVITGAGFTAGAKVSIGGAAATNVAIGSETTITAITPPGAIGAASVVVTTAEGQSATLATGFAYISPALGVTAASPSSGPPVGGTSVTITGAGFLAGATVTIGGNICTNPVVANATTITCAAPAGATGAANIVVTNPDGRNAVLAGGYIYAAASPNPNVTPTVTGISPNSGPTSGGTAIVITGAGFAVGTAVTIAGLACANVTIFNSGKIACTTPAISVGVGGAADVVVLGPSGQGVTIAGGFSYMAPPALAITGIVPSSGPIAGGTPVVISGMGIQAGATVAIGGIACSGVAIFNAGKTLSCLTPAGTAGKVAVSVTNPDGQTASIGGAFAYGATPTVTSVAPSSGPPQGGTPITITGTNFQTGATVKIGGNACSNIVVTGATTISCTTPAGTAGAAPVVIANPDNSTITAPGAFTYAGAAPTIAISPNSGPPAGGTGVTIAGTGFAAGTTVTIGGNPCANVAVPAPTTITCSTPAGAAGAADVVVTPPGGPSASIPGGFIYAAPPSPAAVAPPPVPATTIIAPAFQPVEALKDSDQHRFFKETGHTLNLGFKAYWDAHGSLGAFGYPLSEEFQEKGADGQMRTVQYFERARFEYHPEFKGTPYEVELGLLGREVTQGRESEPPFHRTGAAANTPDKVWFDATGQPLDGLFKKYWDANGGLAVLGYPLTHPSDEQNAADGKTYQVQYFERERLEYHPEFKGTPNEITLGLLGKEVAVKRGYLAAR